MALQLVVADEQQIISKSQQPCAVRFLPRVNIHLTSALQPTRLASPLRRLLHPSTNLGVFESRPVHVCVCDPLRLFAPPGLSCLAIELPSEENIQLWRKTVKRPTSRTLLALKRGYRASASFQIGTGGLFCNLHVCMTAAVFHPGATFSLW